MDVVDERAEYATRLAYASAEIVAAVHDDGPAEALRRIEQALALAAPAGTNPVVALVTVLAAQISPLSTVRSNLDWVMDLDGQPGPMPQVAAAHVSDVQALLSGRVPALGVPKPARREAVRQLTAQHLTAAAIADILRLDERTVVRYRRELAAPAPAGDVLAVAS